MTILIKKTIKGRVYDVTEFAQAHPGGMSNLLLAAGGDLEPFWNLYQQHQTEMVRGILSQYYIGDLDPNEVVETKEGFRIFSKFIFWEFILKPI